MNLRRPAKARLTTQLALAITALIVSVEATMLLISYEGRQQQLLKLRQQIHRELQKETNGRLHQLPYALSDQDIQMRLDRYAVNITLLTIVISIIVVGGTLLVYEFIAGRHMRRLIGVIRLSRPGDIVPYTDKIPQNEVGELIRSRESLRLELTSYEEQLNEKLKEAKGHLIQGAKMAAIGELTSTLIHDLRNPLSVLYSAVELAEMRLKSGDYERSEILQDIEKIKLGASRIRRLADRMNEFNRKDQELLEAQNLCPIVDDALVILEEKLRNLGIEVVVDLPDEHMEFWGNAGMIEQVVINLMANAADALMNHHTREIHLSASDLGDRLMVKVRDTGPGIPEELHSEIFKTFFTTKPKGKGTGLGLSSCLKILEKHSSHLELIASDATGTCFVFYLPKTEPTEGVIKAAG